MTRAPAAARGSLTVVDRLLNTLAAGLLLVLLPGMSVAAEKDSGGAVAVQRATFAAGCFWGVEDRFRRIPGVRDATVGYTGGHKERPTYDDVCSGLTGHAEAVQVEFDPAVVSYEQLLEAFFAMHDPTTKDRQGPDIGSQYRSAVFFHTPEQKSAARAAIERLDESGRFRRAVVTEVVPAVEFWRAEEYHQRYVEKHGGEACGVR